MIVPVQLLRGTSAKTGTAPAASPINIPVTPIAPAIAQPIAPVAAAIATAVTANCHPPWPTRDARYPMRLPARMPPTTHEVAHHV